ncbi:MAG TPA: hypothetical protein DIW46_01705 [Microbacterium sp.]|nr:hypothetical protein [Microbacterium sp.]
MNPSGSVKWPNALPRLPHRSCSPPSVHLSMVKNYISSILVKLGARDRTNAVLRAIREGLLG